MPKNARAVMEAYYIVHTGTSTEISGSTDVTSPANA